MGCKKFTRLSNQQLTRYIRALATASTASIFITPHAKIQMRKRNINVKLVYECLRKGTILRTPEVHMKFDTLECRMERYEAGKNCCVIAALDDELPGMICVTVFFND